MNVHAHDVNADVGDGSDAQHSPFANNFRMETTTEFLFWWTGGDVLSM